MAATAGRHQVEAASTTAEKASAGSNQANAPASSPGTTREVAATSGRQVARTAAVRRSSRRAAG